MVIVFDMVTGEVEYADGTPRKAARNNGMQCPGYREAPPSAMEPQLGLQLVAVQPEVKAAPPAPWRDLPDA